MEFYLFVNGGRFAVGEGFVGNDFYYTFFTQPMD